MADQKLELKEINEFLFYKPKFKKDWVISGADICKYLGYKNPYQQAKKIYNKYQEYFSESSCILELDRKVAGISDLDTVAEHKRRIAIRCYTRPGCWFFVSKCNINKANKTIENLFKSFDSLLKFLESKKTIEWKETREQGKLGRRKMTDAVKKFIEYAKEQGSQNADRYYGNITKTTYNAIGYKGKVPRNFRDNRSAYELAVLNLLEIATDEELYELMERNVPYKDIFKEVKRILTKRALVVIKQNALA